MLQQYFYFSLLRLHVVIVELSDIPEVSDEASGFFLVYELMVCFLLK